MRVVEREAELLALSRDTEAASRLAVDLEASGMFAYRAQICTLQLAWDGEVAVVDALSVPLAALGPVLGSRGPVKIVHDVAFDARLLAEAGLELGNVHDTSIAARMLGRTATGLASLLDAELHVRIDKSLQHHDWRIRPLDDATLAYLGADVVHLSELERVLWREVVERGIEAEVMEETRYRLASAAAAARAPERAPPYARIKGVERLPERERAALATLAEVREREAMRRDVPPHRVASNETLLTLAHARPTTASAVARTRGVATSSPEARAFAEQIARALATAGDTLPEEERARFERPRTPPDVLRARREREARLLAWRREQAKHRGIDEQVVLPGHCVKDVVGEDVQDLEELAGVAGIGAFRVERDGEAILGALRGKGEPST